jgi:hypothetical protein
MSFETQSLVLVVTIGGLMTWGVNRLLKYRKLDAQSSGQPTVFLLFTLVSYVKATCAGAD